MNLEYLASPGACDGYEGTIHLYPDLFGVEAVRMQRL